MGLQTDGNSDSEWSDRYIKAVKRYAEIDMLSGRGISIVAEGLREWASMVPQRAVGAEHHPIHANKWGLEPERCVVRALRSQLVAMKQFNLASRLQSEMADLLTTAESLDLCSMGYSSDDAAKDRLAGTARLQAEGLARLLTSTWNPIFSATENKPKKHRTCRSSSIQEDQRIMQEWSQVRGIAGMTRKEFCQSKNITLQTFIRIQDRVRKNPLQPKE